ncbi:hypothetical protein DFQ26_002116 [Actinomortierella ambigua]|nr:hypothetical protein DFQ26_002116 [Actinomortierella ambigua]
MTQRSRLMSPSPNETTVAANTPTGSNTPSAPTTTSPLAPVHSSTSAAAETQDDANVPIAAAHPTIDFPSDRYPHGPKPVWAAPVVGPEDLRSVLPKVGATYVLEDRSFHCLQNPDDALAASSDEQRHRVVTGLIRDVEETRIWLQHLQNTVNDLHTRGDDGSLHHYTTLVAKYIDRHERLQARLERIQHGFWATFHSAINTHNTVMQRLADHINK